MEQLWGDMQPIPASQLVATTHEQVLSIGGIDITVLETVGHAVHHNAYQVDDRIFTGDVAGVRIDGGPVVAPCHPPDFDIDVWRKSILNVRCSMQSRLL